jgi:UDP-MurNAc hydroxylase
VVLAGGGRTLFNCNDCKLFGLPLRQVLGDYPRIDFLLRSHSSASPVPLCVENHEKLLPQVNDILDSADQFARFALHTRARYAVPFASNHCFLHPETRRFNVTATSPEQARGRYANLAAEVGADSECVVMPPGSGWSEEAGFKIEPFDFSQRERYVAELLERKQGTLSAHAEIEARTLGDFEAFCAYFRGFLSSVPWLVRRRKLCSVLFRVQDAVGSHLWLADPPARSARVLSEVPANAIVIDVHASVINDCTRLKMFSVWTASKRLRIHLPAADTLAQLNLWFTLLDLYETDLLPLRRNFSLRSLSVRLRRWREPVELVNLLLRRLLLRQPMSVRRLYPLHPSKAGLAR